MVLGKIRRAVSIVERDVCRVGMDREVDDDASFLGSGT